MEILLANNVDPDQIPHDVGSDLGLHCLPMTLLRGFQVRMGQYLLTSHKHFQVTSSLKLQGPWLPHFNCRM